MDFSGVFTAPSHLQGAVRFEGVCQHPGWQGLFLLPRAPHLACISGCVAAPARGDNRHRYRGVGTQARVGCWLLCRCSSEMPSLVGNTLEHLKALATRCSFHPASLDPRAGEELGSYFRLCLRGQSCHHLPTSCTTAMPPSQAQDWDLDDVLCAPWP